MTTNAATQVERNDCPKCTAPAGSPCRTTAGKVAASYHTGRFTLVPSLKAELTIKTPADRNPGKVWTQCAAVPTATSDAAPGAPIRIGYARCSTARQELQSQLDALSRAHCTKIFSEKISTRIKIRPEFEGALTLAREIKTAAPDQAVILTVHEMKRLARSAAELMALSTALQKDGIQLEILSGPLQGIHDPDAGAMLFAVLAISAEVEREGIREKTMEGLDTAARNGRHGGRPTVVDADKLAVARARQLKGESVTSIAKALEISRATLYRALAE
ncbi:recombinase family protein [Kitasatospora sp. McL0602]|uniref:recombinase family protein n=1 Tax=Kitasatospora sp. McL0602 TaxID=3439530 RepID=UPI003F88E363